MHDAINATRSKYVKKYFILGSFCLLLLLFLQHYSYGRKFMDKSPVLNKLDRFYEGLTSRKAAPQKTLTSNHTEFS